MTDPFDRCPHCNVIHANGCPPRWPAADLVAFAGSRLQLAAMLGLNSTGKIPVDLSDAHADRWAIRCGVHPSLVWPDWFDAFERFESQRCDLSGSTPHVGPTPTRVTGGRENGQETAA